MRAKTIVADLAIVANSTTTSTPILLVAAPVGSVFAGDEAVSGEDMAFPSSGNAVLALVFDEVTLSLADTVAVLTSVNYYADSGSGETFTAQYTYTVPSAGITAYSSTKFVDKLPLGEAIEVSVVSGHSSGAGSISAYLLNN